LPSRCAPRLPPENGKVGQRGKHARLAREVAVELALALGEAARHLMPNRYIDDEA
jgi:hypothetical protein